jgi:transcriptional regulator with XRE-family HTH domain
VGYRGKLQEKARARELRAQAWTMPEIAEHLGVSRSSVSLWTRDVPFDPSARRSARTDRRPRGSDHPGRRRKLEEIAASDAAGREVLASLTERELLIAGVALYAGEGAKTDGCVSMANTDPELLRLFVTWLRRCFEVDEQRLRCRVYLHEGLDLKAAEGHWSEVVGVPLDRFGKPYRAVADTARTTVKRVYGCATVTYACSATHRQVMGLVRALPSASLPG